MFVIDPRGKEPLYAQLSRQLRRQMALGLLSPDEPLPSVRQLSTELGLNPNTVQKAYRQMEAEGLIYSRPGKGSFVTPQVEDARAREKETRLDRLREALRDARDAGALRGEAEALLDDVYKE